MKRNKKTAREWMKQLCLPLALCSGLLTCLSTPKREKVQHAWDGARGPVVPHDSFPSDCSLCHVGEAWHKIKDSFQFDHEKETGVALRGAHQEAQCLRCHNDRGPVGIFSQKGCMGCHEDFHQGKLGSQCTDCHGEQNWNPIGQIAKHNLTRFPLTGSHAAVACFRCHPGSEVGNFSRTDTSCETCHQADLASATSPDHSALGWTTNCQDCHKPTTWRGQGFLHSQFPLTGAHSTTACTSCHTSGVFAGLSHDCYSCHASDYAGTTDPDHTAIGISTTCQNCHNTSTWSGANFSHAGISSGCYSCHASEYNTTTSPNHNSAGYPTSCEICHNTNSWSGAVFTHTFRITSGPHSAFSCQECHQVPSDYGVISCTHCHEHRQSEANSEHQDVNGYVWENSACISCHPTGNN